MKPSGFFSSHFVAGILLVLCGLATSAFAGPPLICHRLEIGDAKSLPWSGTAWNLAENAIYDTRNLVHDTLAILDSGAPVIVRMETLRRATLYAGKDSQAAKELLTRLYQRATVSETAGNPEALAWFDVGYLSEAYRQWFYKEPNPASGIDGYSFVSKAIALRGGKDPEMGFAAALMTLEGPHQSDHSHHAGKALADAKGDPLLARNLAAQFRGGQTVAQALTRSVMLEAQK
jgi:hypothetical protein